MENKSHALAAGLFVVFVTALLIALAVWLTRDTRQLRSYELAGQVNLSGLQPQANVRYQGVPVGKVTSIRLDPQTQGHVLVRIAVDELAPINANTFATLGYQGVTGLAFIQLDDNKPTEGAAAPLAQLADNSRIPLKPGLVSKLTDRGERVLGQLDEASQRLNQLLSSQNQQTLMTTVGNLGRVASEIQQLTAQTRSLLPELAQGTRDSLALLKATSLRLGDSADAAKTSARAFQRLTERMAGPGGALDQLGQGAEVWVATNQSLQSVTLPRLNLVAQDVARSTRQIGELVQILRDAPQALLLGAPPPMPGPGEPGFNAP
ncbi:MlaD family protein [Rhodoferax sp.]|uniref:MlaD family protein n=1 Tax=Rhodoferax sp. TaxID=50421 RepID=UPI0025EAE50B|nr:MlaD family protein [Rhodoferax sp.]MCM2295569.1 MlaD family protein [Rhodoferax sp.]